MTLAKRIERQRKLVETLERRLAFERLVLERLRMREGGRSDDPEPEPAGFGSIGEVYRAARLRSARRSGVSPDAARL